MTDYVLVHGAWGGAFLYDRLAADLRAAGHRVLACDLSGLGNRKSSFNPGITLSTHIDDVVTQIAEAGFDRLVLAGHSYGGMIITGVSTKLGARIDAMVYIDAFLPEDGQSLWDLTGDFEHAHYIDTQKFTPGAVAPIMGVERPDLSPHPLLTLIEAVRFTGEESKVGKRIYIYATGWQPTPFTRFRDTVQGDPTWTYHESASSHDVMADQPEQLRDIFLSAAA